MRRLAPLIRAGLTTLLACGPVVPACAERIVVPAGQAELQAVLDMAADGDVVLLQAGEHRGSLRIVHRLTLEGEPGAIVQGTGQGSVVTVAAPQAIVRGLILRGSGRDLEKMDAGVFIEKSAVGAIVENNTIEGNLYGAYIHGAADAIVRSNRIVGLREGRVSETGNGVSVWDAPGAKVIGNDIRYGRDGIFSIASRKNVFSGNRFREVRFAVHYMYTNDGEVTDNVSVGNTVGYALMYSNRLTVRGNLSDGDRDRGILFNFANGSQISDNTVIARQLPAERWLGGGMRAAEAREHGLPAGEQPRAGGSVGRRWGPEKCVFIYNTNQNRFRNNWFEGCDIGVHFTAGSEGNEIVGNAFVGNRNQVKYVGTRHLEWSRNGRGNYWSDNPAFDLNGDGVADTAYRPNDLADRILWTAPQAKLLMNSPAIQIIRWAQAQFPAIVPGGVIDSHPLMQPPSRPAPKQAPGSGS